jgi:hypothetical protein
MMTVVRSCMSSRSPAVPGARSPHPGRWWPRPGADLRIHEHGPGQGDALALAAGEAHAAFAEIAVVALGQGADEVVGVGAAGGRLDFLGWRPGGRRRCCSARGAEQVGCCGTMASWARSCARGSSRMSLPSSSMPRTGIIEALQQFEQRDLAGAGGAHERQAAPRSMPGRYRPGPRVGARGVGEAHGYQAMAGLGPSWPRACRRPAARSVASISSSSRSAAPAARCRSPQTSDRVAKPVPTISRVEHERRQLAAAHGAADHVRPPPYIIAARPPRAPGSPRRRAGRAGGPASGR